MSARRNRSVYAWVTLLVVAACGRSELDSYLAGAEASGPSAPTSSSSSAMCLPGGVSCLPDDSCCASECIQGVCGGPRCQPGEPALVLAEGLVWPLGLVVDRHYLYFTSYDQAGALFRVHKNGGPKELVTEADWPHDIAFDDEHLYVTTETSVLRMRKDGTQTTKLANTFGGAGVARRGEDIIWAEYFGKAIKSVPRTGGSSSVLILLPSSPFRLMVHQQQIYFTGLGLTLHQLHDDGSASMLMDHNVRNLTADDSFLYVSVNEQGSHVALRQPLGGGTPLTLFATENFVEGVAVDGTSLYLSSNDAIYRMDKQDGQNASIVHSEPMLAGAIGVDKSCVYFIVRPAGAAEGNGRVMRIPKQL